MFQFSQAATPFLSVAIPPDVRVSQPAQSMKIALVTDAWHPQTNGVVRTLSITSEHLQRMGHDILVVHPGLFRTVPCPTYPEIRLALFAAKQVNGLLEQFAPDAIHIATEGPLGTAARSWCLQRKYPFTTAYHTQFPEYLRARAPIPLSLSYSWLRRFHGAARWTLVATPSMRARLEQHGFENIALWSRGVDTDLFKPGPKQFLDLPRPIFAYVGRVAVEKNVEAFLRLSLPGTKLVIGDGPALATYKAQFPQAVFVGYKYGADLASHIAAADVFVFPSRTDTFGLVLLEAMACGIPAAAYPVTGPIDVIDNGVSGILNENLAQAALDALALDPQQCRKHALRYTWEEATRQLVGRLQRIEERDAR
jgi:glycosyltransferase involved in cell wall biosynthesis